MVQKTPFHFGCIDLMRDLQDLGVPTNQINSRFFLREKQLTSDSLL